MKILTTGYEGQSLDSFLASLTMHGVRLVADVREAPISRKRGFSKSALAEALRTAGIGYVHIRPLGCPKSIRDQYRENGDWSSYTRSYLHHLGGQDAALGELVAMTQTRITALLCYEADYNRCHRTYVARAVKARTASTVCHITAMGLVTEDADSAPEAGIAGSRSATGRGSGASYPSAA